MIDLEKIKKQFLPPQRGEPDYAFTMLDANVLQLIEALSEAKEIIEHEVKVHYADCNNAQEWLSKYFKSQDRKE